MSTLLGSLPIDFPPLPARPAYQRAASPPWAGLFGAAAEPAAAGAAEAAQVGRRPARQPRRRRQATASA